MRLDAPSTAPDPRLAEAARALEALLLRQIVKSSGAFGGGESAGSGVRADMFADALADAVARAGGIGLADQAARSLGGAARGAAAPTSAAAAPAPIPRPRSAATAPGGAEGRITSAAPGLGSPVSGALTSGFGARIDPISGEPATHTGIDVGAPEGTPIRAPAAGVVVRAGARGGYGQAVEIDHGNGVVTLYGHASEVLVSAGDFVEAGTEIARVGQTGRATGPHLHFEVRQAGRPVDPLRALKVYSRRADEPSGADLTARRTP